MEYAVQHCVYDKMFISLHASITFTLYTVFCNVDRTFGELKALRLPKKMVGTGMHRGFAFVDYYTKQDAKVSVFILHMHVCVCVCVRACVPHGAMLE
jgi:hypothetical protein